jgi:hypothetical protein
MALQRFSQGMTEGSKGVHGTDDDDMLWNDCEEDGDVSILFE